MSTSKPKSAPDVQGAGDLVTVEAPTAEEALEELSARLGPGAKILDASKVHRGGVGGFFARELVQLTARRGDPEPAHAAPNGHASNGHASSVERADAFAEALASALTRGMATGNGLRAEPVLAATNGNGNGNGHRAAPAAVTGNGNGAVGVLAAPERASSPRPTGSRRPAASRRRPARRAGGLGEVSWSPDELVRIGLPYKLIEAASRLRTADDVSWIQAVSANAARLCRPLPETPALVAGPRASYLAKALGLPHVSPDEALSARGTVAVSTAASGVDPDWLAEALEGRWLHVVAGGEGWERLAAAGPVAISWIGQDAFVPAVARAWAAGITLGYGSHGRRVLRANPVDIAIEVRDRVTRR